jgi:hypothetical protein
MPPSDAKRMSSGVCVGLVTLFGIEVGCRPEKSRAKSHRLLVSNPRIFDVKIEVDLLGASVWPVRGDVVRCELHPDPPFTGRIDDAVPTLLLEDAPSEESGPERALRVYVRRVEHDDLAHHSHDRSIEMHTRGGQLTPAGIRDTAAGACDRALC